MLVKQAVAESRAEIDPFVRAPDIVLAIDREAILVARKKIRAVRHEMDGVVLTQRPVGLERIGEKRRVDPLYVEIFGKRTRALA